MTLSSSLLSASAALCLVCTSAFAGPYDGNWNLSETVCQDGRSAPMPRQAGPATIDLFNLVIANQSSQVTIQLTINVQGMGATTCRRVEPQTFTLVDGRPTIAHGVATCTTVSGNPQICASMCRGGGGSTQPNEQVQIIRDANLLRLIRTETAPNSFCAQGTTEENRFVAVAAE